MFFMSFFTIEFTIIFKTCFVNSSLTPKRGKVTTAMWLQRAALCPEAAW